MPVSPLHLLLLFAAAFAGGAINSVAGGGTLLTFPALLSVLGPGGSVIANGTSTVALVPGSLSAFWGYRGEMGGARRDLWTMAVPSLLGGALGAYLATHINPALFSRLVPWLIFAATFLFLIQDWVRRRIGTAPTPPAPATVGGGGAGTRPAASGGPPDTGGRGETSPTISFPLPLGEGGEERAGRGSFPAPPA